MRDFFLYHLEILWLYLKDFWEYEIDGNIDDCCRR